jgi:uncharacterized membrane protein YfcA
MLLDWRLTGQHLAGRLLQPNLKMLFSLFLVLAGLFIVYRTFP